MIPEPQDYLSFLMGAESIADDELTGLGITILKGTRTSSRQLLIPGSSLPAYKALVRERLALGYWNEIEAFHVPR